MKLSLTVKAVLGADAIYFWENFRRNPAATADETADLFRGYFDREPHRYSVRIF